VKTIGSSFVPVTGCADYFGITTIEVANVITDCITVVTAFCDHCFFVTTVEAA
jgi:hypothetical protein